MNYLMPKSSCLTDYEKVRRQVKESDLLFTDGKYRIAGIRFLKDVKHMAQVSYIGMRWEIPFASQIAFENRKRIITDPEYSLILFRDYVVGEKIFFVNDNSYKAIRKSDVIITDEKWCSVGLLYDEKKMNAPSIVFLSNDIKTVKSAIKKYNIPEIINMPLARELFTNHESGDEVLRLYYRSVASIYSNLIKTNT